MARICFLWIQELPPDQTGQEEAVNSHGHHLGRTPRDTPGHREFPASPFSSTPHSSKSRLCCSLGKAWDSVLTGFVQEDKGFHFPFSFYLCCVPFHAVPGMTSVQVSQASGSSKHVTSWKLSCGSVQAGRLLLSPGREPWHCYLLLPFPHAELLLIFACLDFSLC